MKEGRTCSRRKKGAPLEIGRISLRRRKGALTKEGRVHLALERACTRGRISYYSRDVFKEEEKPRLRAQIPRQGCALQGKEGSFF